MEQQNNQYHSDIQNKLENGYVFNYQKYISEGFIFLKTNFLSMVAYTIFYFLTGFVLVSLNNSILAILQMILMPVLTAGFFYVIRKKEKLQIVTMQDYGKGFNRLLPLIMANILQSIFITMAFGFLMIYLLKLNPDQEQLKNFAVSPTMELALQIMIIPGLYFVIASLFMVPFIIFRKMNVLPAMESSRLLINKQFLNVTIFLVLLGLINLVGALAFGVGLIISIPLSFASIYFAFKDLIPIQDEYNRQEQDF